MQLEAQTTARGFLAVSAGALEILIIIQGTFEVWSLYLFYHYTYSTFCCMQFNNVFTPSFLSLIETILLREKLFNFDPAFQSLSSSDLDYIIAQICTQ